MLGALRLDRMRRDVSWGEAFHEEKQKGEAEV